MLSQSLSIWNNYNEIDIIVQMTMILGTGIAVIIGLIVLLQQQQQQSSTIASFYFPNPRIEPSKYAYEIYVAFYTPIWIILFGCIVITQYYEILTPHGYILICTILALPYIVQPILLPGGIIPIIYYITGSNHNNHNTKENSDYYTRISPDYDRPFYQRYSFKANVWILIYSFIGNYWYTHYFYNILHASYTMPNAIRFNNVPIQMYCATHFYFTTYHMFSNLLLRKICTTYTPCTIRHVLFVCVIVVFAYFTAFMETMTISSYPYYTFENRYMAYTIGSAFYGIYFIVSFPAFYYFDQYVDVEITTTTATTNTTNTTKDSSSTGGSSSLNKNNNNKSTHNNIVGKPLSLWDTVVQACGYGMIILCLLDFVRLYLNIPLVIGVSSARK